MEFMLSASIRYYNFNQCVSLSTKKKTFSVHTGDYHNTEKELDKIHYSSLKRQTKIV